MGSGFRRAYILFSWDEAMLIYRHERVLLSKIMLLGKCGFPRNFR